MKQDQVLFLEQVIRSSQARPCFSKKKKGGNKTENKKGGEMTRGCYIPENPDDPPPLRTKTTTTTTTPPYVLQPCVSSPSALCVQSSSQIITTDTGSEKSIPPTQLSSQTKTKYPPPNRLALRVCSLDTRTWASGSHETLPGGRGESPHTRDLERWWMYAET